MLPYSKTERIQALKTAKRGPGSSPWSASALDVSKYFCLGGGHVYTQYVHVPNVLAPIILHDQIYTINIKYFTRSMRLHLDR